MQEFYINKDATLPMLKMELISDGRNDFHKFYELIQNSTISFSMINTETGVVKIANQPAYIIPKEDVHEDEYFLVYKWNVRDTKTEGKYIGKFTININQLFGGGTLILPIQEDLIITIK